MEEEERGHTHAFIAMINYETRRRNRESDKNK